MASNYEAICKENRERYGTEGAQKSGKLAAGLYDDRIHFIFELLQNAEDALGRRGERPRSRKVTFTLKPTSLTLSHFGKPFDEADVRSVCDIAESTKNESSIGRFGLGFKSVYTVTDLPQIHSGEEDFAIESYVFPKQLAPLERAVDETQIILPLRPADTSAARDITTGFRHLGPSALLFLRHIAEIDWCVEGGASGFYMRNIPVPLGSNVHRISVIGREDDRQEVDQNWLVFHRDVFSTEGDKVGRVEIAFSLVEVKDVPNRWSVQPLVRSPLVVYFPTVVESHLGFLVQGPYRTTPSRDNIPPGEAWNQYLVSETSELLIEALRWMRDKEMLDVAVLRCLPLNREKFPGASRFGPMFDVVRQAFQKEKLLPAFNNGHVAAQQAKLARTQELRELFSPEQVAALFDSEVTAWLSDHITEVKTPEIRKYLMQELDIDEIRPERVVPKLNKEFLEGQSDEWILRLYEFLSGQGGKLVRVYLGAVPLIRLEDGSHVVTHERGEAKAFLPSDLKTGFPTVRSAVCSTPEILSFLRSLGITAPDPVDDVIRNVLPKYKAEEVNVGDDAYAADIDRICAAFKTDSSAQKDKLRSALRATSFVMVVDSGYGNKRYVTPDQCYIATERLQQLFAGVPDILIVDNEYSCLRGEEIRDLLVSCGASRYLIPQAVTSELSAPEKVQIRKEAGLEKMTWENQPEDFSLRGLKQLLEILPSLRPDEAEARVRVLWEALIDLESRGTAAFSGTYRWGYSQLSKTARFDAAFVRILNQTAWVPNSDGELVPPKLVEFDPLSWSPSPFLLTKIIFKPPIINQLAKEAGIDPAILDLLRRDPALVAELASRLKANPEPELDLSTATESVAEKPSDGDVYDGAIDLYGDDMPDIPPGTLDPESGDDVGTGFRGGGGRTGTRGSRGGSGQGNGGGHGNGGYKDDGKSDGAGKRTPGHAGGRPFISYVGTHPDDDSSDPDGLDQAVRMQIERSAIDLIIRLEPVLRRTPEGNPGYDLFEADSGGKQIRWVEVKSMTGTLEDRPVGLSHTQFDYAREKGDAYWLYVVENSTNPDKARVLRIQNPAGQARTYTFDRGWIHIAQISTATQSLA